jgi:hypothetical protein
VTWARRFEDPIPLPRGRYLVTLEDAGNYITKLPKAVHEAEEWQAAIRIAWRTNLLKAGVSRLIDVRNKLHGHTRVLALRSIIGQRTTQGESSVGSRRYAAESTD